MQEIELVFKLIGMITGNDKLDLQVVGLGLRDNNKYVVMKSLQILTANYSADLAEPVLRLFFSDDDDLWQLAEQVLMQDPLFLFEARFERREESYDRSVAQPAKNHLESFFLHRRIDNISRIVKEFADEGKEKTLVRLARLPGVENLFLERILHSAGQALLNELRLKIISENSMRFPPQISIIPSYACNLNCEYCFAKAMIKNHGADMSESYFQRIMDTVGAEGKVKLVNFLGGEPTQFKELEKFTAAAENRGLKYYLATNGLADRDRFLRISAGKNLVSLTFHIEKDSFYTQPQLALLLANIQAVADGRIHVAFRYNLTDPKNEDWSFMKKYFSALPTFSLSFAVAFPDIRSRDKANSFLQLMKFKSKIMRLIEYVDNFRTDKKIKIAWAKPYPLCFFSAEELKLILRLSTVKNICEIHHNRFTNNLCITPAAYAIPCMALDAPRYRIKDFSCHEELARSSEKKVAKMIHQGFNENCGACILFQMGSCQAACYAYVG